MVCHKEVFTFPNLLKQKTTWTFKIQSSCPDFYRHRRLPAMLVEILSYKPGALCESTSRQPVPHRESRKLDPFAWRETSPGSVAQCMDHELLAQAFQIFSLCTHGCLLFLLPLLLCGEMRLSENICPSCSVLLHLLTEHHPPAFLGTCC